MQELNMMEISLVGGSDRGDATVAGAIAGATAGTYVLRGGTIGFRLGALAGPLGALAGGIAGAAGAYILYTISV